MSQKRGHKSTLCCAQARVCPLALQGEQIVAHNQIVNHMALIVSYAPIHGVLLQIVEPEARFACQVDSHSSAA